METFAKALSFYEQIDRPVVDKTGVTGRYDFKLKWTVDQPDAGEPDAPPGLFTAIQEQLGLKLESTHAPVELLVVDSAERMPTAN